MVKKTFKLNEMQSNIAFLLIALLVICGLLFLPNLFSQLDTNEDINGLVINEYVTSNYNTWRDNEWESPDWIEICNRGDESIWLGDIYISDDAEVPEKALLPDVTLKPGEYFMIFASGHSSDDIDEFHVPFKLGHSDLHISLTREQIPLDIQEVETLPTDISKGRLENGEWAYFSMPTPNNENNTPSSDTPNIAPVWITEKDIIISEYMTNNAYTYRHADGKTYDWVELYNQSDKTVHIGDMYLSDDKGVQNKFNLPDYDMQPGEYLVINLTGSLEAPDEFCAPFNLGGSDTHIVLTAKSGYAIDMLNVFSLPEGISAGQNEAGDFGFYSLPTPGEKNSIHLSSTPNISPEKQPSSGLIISEFMPNNRYGIPDAYGKSSDWIEIHNPSSFDISIGGFGLSDDASDPLKWVFPEDALLPANGYLVIYASGNNTVFEGEYHTNFSLGESDEIIILSEPDAAIADSMIVEKLPGNVSKGIAENGEAAYFTVPTPGYANTTHPSNDLDLGEDIILTDLYISEVSASKIALNRKLNLNAVEYIELYNAGTETIDLTGYSISESNGGEFFFSNITLKPDKYLLLIAKGGSVSGVDCVTIENIRINSAGETLFLKDNEGKIIDCLKTGYLLGNYSCGRSRYDKYTQTFFNEKTPGVRNSNNEYVSICQEPVFSQVGGMVSGDSIFLELKADEGEIIKYTINGNDPAFDSYTYSKPIKIDENTVVRAIALSERKLPSSIASSTYILDGNHDIPIMCLSTSNYNLFSETYGIYASGNISPTSEFPYLDANYWRDEERPVSIEYYETDGKLALDFNAGIQIFGGFSRTLPQKSFVIHMRDEYGLDELYYPFFEDSDVNTYKDFLLRGGGQDTRTKLKDYYIAKCAIEDGGQDAMLGTPTAVYINGEYWGIYNIREKINADYISSHYGFEKENINLIAANGVALNGNANDWNELKTFCTSNDFSIDENYEKLCSWVDVENYTDYIIFQTFFSNTDSGNIKFWRDGTETIKWRVLFYDVDLTLRENSSDIDMISRMFGQAEYIGFSTHIQEALIQNPEYQQYFLQRYEYYLNEVFTDEYFEEGIDEIAKEMETEMVNQTQRWTAYGSYEQWVEQVELFKDSAQARGEVIEEMLREFLG